MGQLTRIGDHPAAPGVITLGRRTIVGRLPPCDVVIDDSSMSRQHALLVWRADHWEVLDLESLNGTRVNGRRLDRGQTARLTMGTEIVFGQGPVWRLTSDEAPDADAR